MGTNPLIEQGLFFREGGEGRGVWEDQKKTGKSTGAWVPLRSTKKALVGGGGPRGQRDRAATWRMAAPGREGARLSKPGGAGGGVELGEVDAGGDGGASFLGPVQGPHSGGGGVCGNPELR